jgi:hypothetical protein
LRASKVTTAQPLSFRRRQFPSQLGRLNRLNLSLLADKRAKWDARVPSVISQND